MKSRPHPPSASPSAPATVTTPALDWAVGAGAVEEVFARVESKLRRRRRRALGVATAFVVLLAAGAAWWHPASVTGAKSAIPIATATATAPRRQLLEDGTLVELREGAQLSVEFTPGVRRVALANGEAHFQVAKNPARPFVVTAGGVDVRAIGTAFAVQLGASIVEVLVTEGQVAVEKSSAPADRFANVAAGNRVVVELARAPASVPVVAVARDEIDERLSWRIPRLDLTATPLAQALAFFNQHSGTHLVLDDAELGKLELSGSIRAENPEPLLRLLRAEFGLEAERRSGEIVLHRRK